MWVVIPYDSDDHNFEGTLKNQVLINPFTVAIV